MCNRIKGVMVVDSGVEQDKIEAARAEGERERKKIVDDANREAVAIAEAAMDKLVNEHTSAAYDDFLKTVEGESK